MINKAKYPTVNNWQCESQERLMVHLWCISQPIRELETPEFDNEGRILSLEFKDFILINFMYQIAKIR